MLCITPNSNAAHHAMLLVKTPTTAPPLPSPKGETKAGNTVLALVSPLGMRQFVIHPPYAIILQSPPKTYLWFK
jgi:hypothetical protein